MDVFDNESNRGLLWGQVVANCPRQQAQFIRTDAPRAVVLNVLPVQRRETIPAVCRNALQQPACTDLVG